MRSINFEDSYLFLELKEKFGDGPVEFFTRKKHIVITTSELPISLDVTFNLL